MAARSNDDLSNLEHESGCLVAISCPRRRTDFLPLVVDHSQEIAWPTCRSHLLSADAFPSARFLQSLLLHVCSWARSSRCHISRRSFSISAHDCNHPPHFHRRGLVGCAP